MPSEVVENPAAGDGDKEEDGSEGAEGGKKKVDYGENYFNLTNR